MKCPNFKVAAYSKYTGKNLAKKYIGKEGYLSHSKNITNFLNMLEQGSRKMHPYQYQCKIQYQNCLDHLNNEQQAPGQVWESKPRIVLQWKKVHVGQGAVGNTLQRTEFMD